jgi:dephospho-CoA kinase
MILLGLTGGIASGKSTVARLLAVRGITVVDCDLIARELQEPGQPALAAILARFPSVAAPDGSLDREALGQLVFTNSAARSALNNIMRPYLFVAIVRAVVVVMLRTPLSGFVCLDIPLLFESRIFRPIVDVSMVVSTSDDVRIARLVTRDAPTRGVGPAAEAAARARITAQMPLAVKARLADIVIDNNGDQQALSKNVDAALREAQRIATPRRCALRRFVLGIYIVLAVTIVMCLFLWRRAATWRGRFRMLWRRAFSLGKECVTKGRGCWNFAVASHPTINVPLNPLDVTGKLWDRLAHRPSRRGVKK